MSCQEVLACKQDSHKILIDRRIFLRRSISVFQFRVDRFDYDDDYDYDCDCGGCGRSGVEMPAAGFEFETWQAAGFDRINRNPQREGFAEGLFKLCAEFIQIEIC
jgi:hypothetical protein